MTNEQRVIQIYNDLQEANNRFSNVLAHLDQLAKELDTAEQAHFLKMKALFIRKKIEGLYFDIDKIPK